MSKILNFIILKPILKLVMKNISIERIEKALRNNYIKLCRYNHSVNGIDNLTPTGRKNLRLEIKKKIESYKEKPEIVNNDGTIDMDKWQNHYLKTLPKYIKDVEDMEWIISKIKSYDKLNIVR
jgi:hypothetical protein